MATQVQLRGGTTSQHGSFTGAVREVTVDTDKETLVVHDGSTAGGFPMARADGTGVTNFAVGGTLGVTGKITADAGIDIDNINIDGTTIALSSGNLTLDVQGVINLDSDGGGIYFKDAGTTIAEFINNSSDFELKVAVQDKDIRFRGNDGGTAISALTLDMSDAGTAIFNHDISLADNGKANFGSSADFQIYHDSSNAYLRNELSDSDIIFQVNDGGSQVEVGRFDASSRGFAVGVNETGLHTCVIKGDTGGNAVLKTQNSAGSGNTTTYLSFMDGSGSASVNSAHFQGYNGANNFYLLGNGTTTFTSDENAKKNIETTRDGYLEDLAKLRVVKYNWKEDEDGADKELGLIAQEVETVFPKLVMLDIDPQIEDADKKKMIKTTVLPFMLLKALQEANTKMTALEARITELEGA